MTKKEVKFKARGGNRRPKTTFDSVFQPIIQKRLASYRRACGYTLLEIEKIAGINKFLLSNIENGRRNVTLSLLERLSPAYGWDYLIKAVLLGVFEFPILDQDELNAAGTPTNVDTREEGA